MLTSVSLRPSSDGTSQPLMACTASGVFFRQMVSDGKAGADMTEQEQE